MHLTGDVYKNKRIAFVLGVSITLLSLVFLSVTLKGYFASRAFKTHASPAEAVITDIIAKPSSGTFMRWEYTVMVEYTVNGVLRQGRLNYYLSEFYVGQPVAIYVDNTRPDLIMGAEEGKITAQFTIMLLLFLAAGIGFTVYAVRLALAIKKAFGKSQER